MFWRARALLTIVACVLATPIFAQAPERATMAFDGTYLGVSNTFEGNSDGNDARTWTRYCLHFGPPGTLTIVNGIARAGKIEGSVSPQGVLVMRDFWSHFDGRIDSQGIVRARATGGCSYQLVWQKVPPPTMPFDGDYIGVSRELVGGGAGCPSNVFPAPLIIRNSVVLGQWEGTANSQGALVMQKRVNTKFSRVDAQIDSQGTIIGQYRGGDGSEITNCIVNFVWRKQSG